MRFQRRWTCWSCDTPIPNGTRLDCDACAASLDKARDYALARAIERESKWEQESCFGDTYGYMRATARITARVVEYPESAAFIEAVQKRLEEILLI
jgi:hypothetical protein